MQKVNKIIKVFFVDDIDIVWNENRNKRNHISWQLFLDLGWIIIDRCGTHFGTIMNFLRDGSVPLPETSKGVAELLAEAKYYCITELADSCERALLKKVKIDLRTQYTYKHKSRK